MALVLYALKHFTTDIELPHIELPHLKSIRKGFVASRKNLDEGSTISPEKLSPEGGRHGEVDD
jgi:hypothetical protein